LDAASHQLGSKRRGQEMRQVYERCAGLDVHKKSVVACRAQVMADGQWVTKTKTFGTMT